MVKFHKLPPTAKYYVSVTHITAKNIVIVYTYKVMQLQNWKQ